MKQISSSVPIGQLEQKQKEEVSKVQESIAGGEDIKKFSIRPQTKPTDQLRS